MGALAFVRFMPDFKLRGCQIGEFDIFLCVGGLLLHCDAEEGKLQIHLKKNTHKFRKVSGHRGLFCNSKVWEEQLRESAEDANPGCPAVGVNVHRSRRHPATSPLSALSPGNFNCPQISGRREDLCVGFSAVDLKCLQMYNRAAGNNGLE